MKREIIILAITVFFILNTYHDGKYIDMMRGWKKYYTMIGYAFAGLSVVLYMKKMGNQPQYSDILTEASNLIKHMPIDQNSSDVITPMMGFMKSNFTTQFPSGSSDQYIPPQQKRMMRSGDRGTKRSVGETKKSTSRLNRVGYVENVTSNYLRGSRLIMKYLWRTVVLMKCPIL